MAARLNSRNSDLQHNWDQVARLGHTYAHTVTHSDRMDERTDDAEKVGKTNRQHHYAGKHAITQLIPFARNIKQIRHVNESSRLPKRMQSPKPAPALHNHTISVDRSKNDCNYNNNSQTKTKRNQKTQKSKMGAQSTAYQFFQASGGMVPVAHATRVRSHRMQTQSPSIEQHIRDYNTVLFASIEHFTKINTIRVERGIERERASNIAEFRIGKQCHSQSQQRPEESEDGRLRHVNKLIQPKAYWTQ